MFLHRRPVVLSAAALLFVVALAAVSDHALAGETHIPDLTFLFDTSEGTALTKLTRRVFAAYNANRNVSADPYAVEHRINFQADPRENIKILESFTAPEIIVLYNGPMRREMIDQGRLVDLTDLWDELGFATDGLASAKDFCSGSDGRQYAVPLSGTANLCMINKAIFAAHGESVPTTWSEFRSLCQRFKAAGQGCLGNDLTFMAPSAIVDYLFIRMHGTAAYLDLIGSRMPFSDPRVRSAFQVAAELVEDGVFVHKPDADPPNLVDARALATGEAAIFCGFESVSGMSIGAGLDPNDLGAFQFPVYDGDAGTAGPGVATDAGIGALIFFGVPTNSRFHEESINVLRHIGRADVQRTALANMTGAFPLRYSLEDAIVSPATRVSYNMYKTAGASVARSSMAGFGYIDILSEWQTTLYSFATSSSAAAAMAVVDQALPQLESLRLAAVLRRATPPVAEPESGTFNTPITVSLQSFTDGAALHYTLDGSTPSKSSPLYVSGISLATSGKITLRAIAVSPDLADSEISTAEYVIDLPGDSTDDSKTTMILAIVLSLVACVLLVAGLVGYLMYRRKSVTYKLSSDSELVIDPSELVVGRAVGEGSFGTVYRGTWRATSVAIKRTHKKGLVGRELREFVDEASLLLRLRHPNVLLFLGITLDPPSLITEFMNRGNLYEVLHSQEVFLDNSVVFKWAHNMTQGLQYLAHAGVVHGDLKSLNILMDASWVPKIADFGMSSIKTANKVVTADNDVKSVEHTSRASLASGGSLRSNKVTPMGAASVNTITSMGNNKTDGRHNVGTLFWTAPEVLANGQSHMSSASDAYSLGLTIYELATRLDLYAGENPLAVALEVMEGRRPDPERILPGLSALRPIIEGLWSQDPNDRPSFDEVATRIEPLYNLETVVTPKSASLVSGNIIVCHVELPLVGMALLNTPGDASVRLSGLHEAARSTAKAAGMAVLDWSLESVTLGAHNIDQTIAFIDTIGSVTNIAGPVLLMIARGDISTDPTTKIISGPVMDTIVRAKTTLLHGETRLVDLEAPILLATQSLLCDISGPAEAAGIAIEVFDEVPELKLVRILHPDQLSIPSIKMPSPLPAVLTDQSLSVFDEHDTRAWMLSSSDVQALLTTSTDSWMGSYALSHHVMHEGSAAVLKVFLRQDFSPQDLIRIAVLVAKASHSAQVDSTNLLVGPIRACFSPPNVAIVFPSVSGGSLRDRLPSMTSRQKISVAKTLVDALLVLHSLNGGGHGALRPTNILVVEQVDGSYSSRLIDYGLAAIKSNMGTMTLIPSVSYLSPEDLRGEAATMSGDIFVLGSLLYEMAALAPAFTGSNALEVGYKLSTGYRPPINEAVSTPALVDIIARCWEDDPLNRPTLEQIRTMLQHVETFQ